MGRGIFEYLHSIEQKLEHLMAKHEDDRPDSVKERDTPAENKPSGPVQAPGPPENAHTAHEAGDFGDKPDQEDREETNPIEEGVEIDRETGEPV